MSRLHTSVTVLTAAVCFTVLMGCNDDRFLSGQWLLSEGGEKAIDGRLFGCQGSEEECRVWIEVNLGHFGEDVVGVIRWFDDQNRLKRRACNAKNPAECCLYVEGRFRDDRFTFDYEDWDPQTEVFHSSFEVISSSEVAWKIAGRDGIETQTVTLIKSGQALADDKICEPPEPDAQ